MRHVVRTDVALQAVIIVKTAVIVFLRHVLIAMGVWLTGTKDQVALAVELMNHTLLDISVQRTVVDILDRFQTFANQFNAVGRSPEI